MEEKVYWCARCKSISVVESRTVVFENEDVVYCKDCGATDIHNGSYGEWEILYKEYRIQKNINYGNRNYSSSSIKAHQREIQKKNQKPLKSSILVYYIK